MGFFVFVFVKFDYTPLTAVLHLDMLKCYTHVAHELLIFIETNRELNKDISDIYENLII